MGAATKPGHVDLGGVDGGIEGDVHQEAVLRPAQEVVAGGESPELDVEAAVEQRLIEIERGQADPVAGEGLAHDEEVSDVIGRQIRPRRPVAGDVGGQTLKAGQPAQVGAEVGVELARVGDALPASPHGVAQHVRHVGEGRDDAVLVQRVAQAEPGARRRGARCPRFEPARLTGQGGLDAQESEQGSGEEAPPSVAIGSRSSRCSAPTPAASRSSQGRRRVVHARAPPRGDAGRHPSTSPATCPHDGATGVGGGAEEPQGRARLTRRKAAGKTQRLQRSSRWARCRRRLRQATWTTMSSTMDRKMIE